MARDQVDPALLRLRADAGVARFLDGRSLIRLSLQGKRHDVFWFSFFRDVAHVLKHPTRAIVLDDAAAGDTVGLPEEQEANRVAADTLIPRAHQARLPLLPLAAAGIEAFAAEIGVHPGVLVGQLQHRDLLPGPIRSRA